MDQSKATENVQVADSEKVQSPETSNNVPSSGVEKPPSDKPQHQPTSLETPTQPSTEELSGDMLSTEKPSSEKTLDQPSSENTPNTGDMKSSTQESEVNPVPATQKAEEQKTSGERSEEGKRSAGSEQDPNANTQMSSSNTDLPEQLTSSVQDVPIADEPSTKAPKAKDAALNNRTNKNEEPKTEEQSPKVKVNDTGEDIVKVDDSANPEPPVEALGQQPEANLDHVQTRPKTEDTIGKQQAPTDQKPIVESIPNKVEDNMSKAQTEENSSPEKQDGGKESLNAPPEEITKSPVEEIGAANKVDTEGPRHRFGKAPEDEKSEEKEPEEKKQEEADAGASGDSGNVADQGGKPEIGDVLSDLMESLDSPVVCGLVVFALLVFVVILRCTFSLNAICYTLLYYSVLIIFGYPLTLCMARNNLDRSVIRAVVGVFCLLFAILFYKCRPTITWMTEISELL